MVMVLPLICSCFYTLFSYMKNPFTLKTFAFPAEISQVFFYFKFTNSGFPRLFLESRLGWLGKLKGLPKSKSIALIADNLPNPCAPKKQSGISQC